MHILAVLVGLFSAAAAVVSWKTGDNIVLLLAGVGFLCAFTTYQSRTIFTFLQIFAAIFAIETVIFGIVFLISEIGLWPALRWTMPLLWQFSSNVLRRRILLGFR